MKSIMLVLVPCLALAAVVSQVQAQDLVSWNMAADRPWTATESNECLISYRNDGLIIGTKTRNYPCAAWTNKTFASNVRIETEVAVAHAPELLAYGIGFARSTDGYYFLFELETVGKFALYQNTASGWKTITPMTESSAYRPGLEAPNKMTVEIRGTVATLFLNDAEVGRYNLGVDLTGDVVLYNNSEYPAGTTSLLSTQVIFKTLRVSTLATANIASNAGNDPYEIANAGIALFATNKSEAIAKLRQAVQMAPDVAVFHDRLAQVLMSAESYPEAEAEAKRATHLAPDSTEFRKTLGYTYRAQKMHDAAATEFETVVARNPSDADAVYALGDTRIAQSRFAEAEQVLRPFADQRPGNTSIHEKLAEAYRAQSKFAPALAEMQKAAAAGSNSVYNHYWRGRDAWESGATAEAVRELQAAARLDP
ncbi:MAG TPA: tetratricopeptide repeat protein, partial [Longimicrobiales bacterium]|nr:tetratricopeptide repeat protein [Longimicrobiales bacterium]